MQHAKSPALCLFRAFAIIAALALICLWTDTAISQSTAATYTEVDLVDKQRQRPLKLSIWYSPTNQPCAASICIANNAKTDRVFLLSHGSMGSAKDYNWIGYALASQGFVVVGVNHYQESWVYGPETIDPAAALNISDRVNDVQFTLDQLGQEQQNISNRRLNTDNVTMIGHSAGGLTALVAVGASMSLQQAITYCRSPAAASDKSCAYLAQIPASMPATAIPAMTLQNNPNERIKNLILLDPAGGHTVEQQSLSSIQLPTLIVVAQDNDFLPAATHGKYYAENLPQAQLITLNNGEGHFVYLDKCNHSHQAMGIAICQDREGVDRDAVHQRLYGPIFEFIYR